MDWFINNFYKTEKEHLGDKVFELIEKESAEVPPGANHLIFSPWFLGERCPVSTTTTRSSLFNLSHEHTRGHFARAHFEGIAFNLRWMIENMEKDFGFDLRKLRIIGGGVANDLWMQTIADVTQREIIRTSQPKMAGALGVANCVLAGSGEMAGFDSIHDFVKTTDHFQPNEVNEAIYSELFATYKQLYKSLEETYKRANYERFSK
ncbi:MAG: hypothetical protein GY705_21255 [Bacteroidetes bacterium]|nr:hypothetical protein [Bacteroidota bacterium]